MTKNVEYFFMYLFAICTSFENCLFNSSSLLLIRLFVLLVFNLCSSYVLAVNLLSHGYLAKFFFHTVDYLFILVIVSVVQQKFFN
jgi:hypothetical protein